MFIRGYISSKCSRGRPPLSNGDPARKVKFTSSRTSDHMTWMPRIFDGNEGFTGSGGVYADLVLQFGLSEGDKIHPWKSFIFSHSGFPLARGNLMFRHQSHHRVMIPYITGPNVGGIDPGAM